MKTFKSFGIIALVVCILDQWSKFWAVSRLTQAFQGTNGNALSFAEKVDKFLWFKHPPRSGSVDILKDFWSFRYVENPGAAWGFLASSDHAWRTPFFLVVALIAMVFIVYLYKSAELDQLFYRLALALVFGGAWGNFIDRVRLGYVIDFIDWHYKQHRWPTFNIADAAITIGAVLMIADIFLYKKNDVGEEVSSSAS
ncbi:MAG: signal peptidase II [Myxococcota bacterium]|jgi:signal peptidase II|nr:signal peptidase II [Myxococcota bacterium]